MELKLSQLLPNPFRKIEQYPIDKEKVATLVDSIMETDFWDNLLARPAPKNGKYELAYGHHRLEAAKQAGIKKVDIPIRNLSNARMIKIMANENMEQYRADPKTVLSTIVTAKEFLDSEISKCSKLKDFSKRVGAGTRSLFANESTFQKAKVSSVGKDILGKFLGVSWKEWLITEALATIRDVKKKEVSQEAIEEFKSMRTSEPFREVAKEQRK